MKPAGSHNQSTIKELATPENHEVLNLLDNITCFFEKFPSVQARELVPGTISLRL